MVGRHGSLTGDPNAQFLDNTGAVPGTLQVDGKAHPGTDYVADYADTIPPVGYTHELMTLITTAREMRSQYEFSAHARLARAGGVSDETIKIIATGAAPEGLTGDEALLSGYVKEMLQQHKVSDATYKALVDRFGEQDTLHLAVLVGHYMLVAQVLATMDVELGEGMVAEIPE